MFDILIIPMMPWSVGWRCFGHVQSGSVSISPPPEELVKKDKGLGFPVNTAATTPHDPDLEKHMKKRWDLHTLCYSWKLFHDHFVDADMKPRSKKNKGVQRSCIYLFHKLTVQLISDSLKCLFQAVMIALCLHQPQGLTYRRNIVIINMHNLHALMSTDNQPAAAAQLCYQMDLSHRVTVQSEKIFFALKVWSDFGRF